MSNSDASLIAARPHGRKYLNAQERKRFLSAASQVDLPERLFVETLAWTGGRISEVLSLCPCSFDQANSTVTLPTLKRRKCVTREVPFPPELMRDIERCFDLRARQRDHARSIQPLWPFCRTTGWRIIKRVMNTADIIGVRASPRGLRHAFGVGTLQAGVPITLLKRWLGHARLSTTEIYADVIGPEELGFASRYWTWSKSDGGTLPAQRRRFS